MKALFLAIWVGVAAAQPPPAGATAAPIEAPAEVAPATDAEPAEAEPKGIPGMPPGPAPDPAAVDDITHALAKSLRCPVCQGLSVADSPSESAVAMKGRIRDLVAAGYTEEQIVDYFVSRYGEWILLAPPMSNNRMVWLAPAFVAGLALAWVASVVARWRAEPEKLPSDEGLLPKDEYEQRLLEEISEK